MENTEMRTFYYKEDNQGYYFELIEFETDCKMDTADMSDMTWAVPGAGRMSTSFDTFCEIMDGFGFKVTYVWNHGKNARIPKGKPFAGVVIGATGNY